MEKAKRVVLEGLEAMVAETRSAVSEIAVATTDALRRSGDVRRGDLAPVEPLVRSLLGDAETRLHGAGFVAAPNMLTDAPWWLEWFAWDGGRGIQRLVPETNPSGAHFFDYTLMPWYAGPAGSHGRLITGPYVDYLCTDDYTLTFTEAVLHADLVFAGVAGADVRVIAVEEEFLGPLRASSRLLVLVNRLGRVVVSNSARLLSGTLVDELDMPELFAHGDPRLHVVGGSELGLLDLGEP
jgi:hypothetical protein